ncbi:hypothetical protein ABZ897_26355 [Nonomuraea sp. NPDC046802]|uniref:hypothetical protein n=1 Tax=Nonomuraea sp. NPDC046802 TaxID=3154919 RepID=UPI0033C3512D
MKTAICVLGAAATLAFGLTGTATAAVNAPETTQTKRWECQKPQGKKIKVTWERANGGDWTWLSYVNNCSESKAIRLYFKNTEGITYKRCVVAKPKSTGRKSLTDKYDSISKVTVTNTCSG